MRARWMLRWSVAAAVVLAMSSPTWAATNLVSNPSGSGGSTAGWGTGRPTTDTIKAVQVGGQWWLQWITPQKLYDWAVYKFAPGSVTAGTQYTCGFEAMGSGTVYAVIWDGKNLNRGTPAALTNKPQVFTETATMVNPSNSPEFEVRANSGPVDVYFNEVTCVQGSSVSIPLESVSLSSSSASSSTSSSSSAASSSTASSATSTSSPSSSTQKLPSTGQAPWTSAAGLVLLAGGLTAAWRSRRASGARRG